MCAVTTPPDPTEPTSSSEPVPTSPPPPAAPPPIAPSTGWSAPNLAPADRVRVAWQQRVTTDYRFDRPWLNVFLILVTCGIFGFYLFYQLMRRSRDHNRRRLELLDGATAFAWEQASSQGLAEALRPNFERIAGHLQTMRAMTTDFRDPAIWLLISIVASSIAHIIAFVLLDGDLIKHDRAEGAVESELSEIYARLGQPIAPPDPARVKSPDNYAGRIVATVLTCGVYSLWWWVDQQRDGDAHYAQNWPWEDSLAQAVQQLQPTA